MKRIAWIFPGQGSQKVGMGMDWLADFPEAREVFEEADDTLGFALSDLCREGPEEDLQLTANTQPAILTCSIAILRAVSSRLDWRPVAAAGHSLGEYSALVAAGTLELADALRLVRKRGELMQEAVPVGKGAMAALIGLADETVEAITRQAAGGEVCEVANRNSPGQLVIAGHRGAVERAIDLAQQQGAKRAALLPVSAPFHSSLMAPARVGLAPQLAATPFKDPAMPVVSNIDARPAAGGEAARNALERQIDGPVRWVESIRWMLDEAAVEAFVELGPGLVLTGLGRRIDRAAKWLSCPKPGALDRLERQLADDS